MTEIYGGSSGNLVHLPDNAPLASRAVECVQSVARVALQDINSYKDFDFLTSRPIPEACLRTLENMDSTALQALLWPTFI